MNQRNLTEATHFSGEIYFARTPHQKAAGNLKNKKVFNFKGENSITSYFKLKYKKTVGIHTKIQIVNFLLNISTLHYKVSSFSLIFV